MLLHAKFIPCLNGFNIIAFHRFPFQNYSNIFNKKKTTICRVHVHPLHRAGQDKEALDTLVEEHILVEWKMGE